MVGGSSFPVMTPDELDTKLDADSLGAARALHRLRRDHRDRRPACIVQFALRVAQFYMHESCGKCTPCRVGTRWLVQILRAVEDGTRDGERPRGAARRLRPHHRQVPLRARRLGGDAGRELRDEVPRRVPRAPRRTAAARSARTRRSRTCSRRSTSTRTRRSPQEVTRMSTPELVRVTIDEQGRARRRRARASSRPRSPPASRFPSSATSRGSARRSAPAACASSRSRACRSCRPAARSPRRTAWSCSTARTSAKAAEGQNATLEFILVNHPLDCPVCDKGGECPLQDLTFRYGPGKTRMNFEKTTFEKPIPISPTISLDRERCILCYRCTRFSESVARTASSSRATAARCR